MSEFDLFEGRDDTPGTHESGEGPTAGAPLAARMRPRTLDEYVGQQHLLAPGRALRELIEKDAIGSIILWGPPGTGKTTIARIIADRTNAAFVEFSAVTEGVARVREIIREAEARRRAMGRRTILFCDEIHRFNKAQQDAFLPHVEKGTVALIGATTENPSFEVIGALLSRSRVFVLEPLSVDDVRMILERALADEARGLGSWHINADDDALTFLAEQADGDARRALNGLEAAAEIAGAGGTLSLDVARMVRCTGWRAGSMAAVIRLRCSGAGSRCPLRISGSRIRRHCGSRSRPGKRSRSSDHRRATCPWRR
jgi:putative ATPase